MSPTTDDEAVSRALDRTGEALRQTPSARDAVMRRVNEAVLNPPPQRASFMRRYRWRAIGSAAAACVIVGLVLMQLQSGDRASEAFARAISAVANAHTFSCRQVHRSVDKSGNVEIEETISMFKEQPDRERMEWHKGPDRDGQVTIIDFAQRRRLTLNGDGKNASLEDISKSYQVDDQTGELVPLSLDTNARDQIMKLTAESVKDAGTAQLNGKTVHLYQSIGKKSGSTRTVYIDPETHQPVQIVIQYKLDDRDSEKEASWTFADIKIDQPLDDSLFSLNLPAGYQLFGGGAYVPAEDHYSKMMTKMRNVIQAMFIYVNDKNVEMPEGLPTDLKQLIGPEMSEKKLKTLLAPPERSDDPSAMVYIRPRTDVKEWSSVVILYEKPEHRLDKKVCVGFLDGHCEVVNEPQFDALMKKQQP